MYQMPTKGHMESLRRHRGRNSITAYIRLGDEADSAETNRLRFKHVFETATKILEAQGMRQRDIQRLLQPAQGITASLWNVKNRTAVFFIHEKHFSHLLLPPIDRDEPYEIMVKGRFVVDEIDQLMHDNQEVVVLTLSHKGVRLFEADNHYAREIFHPDLPNSMREELNLDEAMTSFLEGHAVSNSVSHSGAEMFHGHYEPNNTQKLLLRDYFRRVDEVIRSISGIAHRPLLLAGVAYLHPIYRGVSKHEHILEQEVHGNLDNSSPSEIHRKVVQTNDEGISSRR